MEDFLTLLLAGISVGSVYGLIAIGLNLTFWTTKTMNFGQGSVMMLCAIITAALIGAGWRHPLAALAALAVIVVLMVFTETYTVRPALKIEGSMGWAVRASTAPKATSAASPPATAPQARGWPQPRAGAASRPKVSAASPRVARVAPGPSLPVAAGSRVSGTLRQSTNKANKASGRFRK